MDEVVDFSPEFRRRLGMIVRRARAEAVTSTRSAIAVGPDGPLPEGAATRLTHFNDNQIRQQEPA